LELLEAASVIGPSFASQTLAALVDRAVTDVELVCTAMARAGQFLREIEPAAPHRATRRNTASKKTQSFQPAPWVQVFSFALGARSARVGN
jgi:hypothetical protein